MKTLYIPIQDNFDNSYSSYMLNKIESSLHNKGITHKRHTSIVSQAYINGNGFISLYDCIAYTLSGAIEQVYAAMITIDQQVNKNYFIK